MRPIFTIHAGEYLAGVELEHKISSNNKYNDITLWIPAKDTGVDLLLLNRNTIKTVTLQVKFSKDFNTNKHKSNDSEERKKVIKAVRAESWFSLNIQKIENSQAEFWIFVVFNFTEKSNDFIILPIDILKNLANQYVTDTNSYNTNNSKQRSTTNLTLDISVFESNNGIFAFNVRPLGINDYKKLVLNPSSELENLRNLTMYLNKWELILDNLL